MAEPISTDQHLKGFRDDFAAMQREIGKMIVGQQTAVEAALIAAVAGGHLLIEGTPGLGKTALAETMADVVQLVFQRIQFTPDLMPADLLGTYVVMETPQGRRTFEFQKGPIFSNLILADHINRGMPKTQSALLEAMEGESVSVSNETFQLPQPFFVVATQNPQEMEGTYALPEPELDRFFFKVVMPPPNETELETILDRTTEGETPVVAKVCDGRRLIEMREIARRLPIDAELRRKAIALVAATSPQNPRAPQTVRQFISYGASPRAAQALVAGAKIHAAARGQRAVATEDVRAVTPAALRHRLILNFEGQAENISPERLVQDVLQSVFPGTD